MDKHPEKIVGRITTTFIREKNILQVNLKENSMFGVSDAMEVIEAARVLGGGKKLFNLIVAGKGAFIDEEARKYSSSINGCRYKYADAYVLNSIAQKLIANFIIKIQKPPVPTALFNDEETAVKWLKSLNV
jgi:hypothetical protein